jgi:hypothetical protein
MDKIHNTRLKGTSHWSGARKTPSVGEAQHRRQTQIERITPLMPRKNANGAQPTKKDMPSKVCAACERPFTWRKKWARDWEYVKYCSDACRSAGRPG